MSAPPSRLLSRPWAAPALTAALALAAVVWTLDPAGSYPALPAGPGLTVDETFNVQQGWRLAEGLPMLAVGGLTLRELFGDHDDQGAHAPFGYHLPDHPPLGRLWIGIGHKLTRAAFLPHDHPSPFATACARTAPASAFALLVFLVGWATAHRHGPLAGAIAAAAVVLMPRLFGHAHLAALETFIGLAYAAAVFSVAGWWSPSSEAALPLRPAPDAKSAARAGAVFGLALLIKIQAVLLPVPVALWALWHWRRRAVLPLAVWGGVAFLVFFVGWPWLWLDPWNHLTEYFGRTTERAELHVWYLGQRFGDRSVPWHYPWVMFLTTIPLGLHLLGAWGVWTARPAWRDPYLQLVLAAIVFPLAVFSLPRVATYDGARLFLVVFPLWAVFVGRGGAAAFTWLRDHTASPRLAATVLVLGMAAQSWGLLALSPCWLSYYNLCVGGLRGAEPLGLEPTYWGDSISRGLLEETARHVPAGATVHVTPVLHPFQLDEMLIQSPVLRRHRLRLREYDPASEDQVNYVLVFQRRADLPAEWHTPPAHARPVAEVHRQGVLLAALYVLDGRH